VWWQDREKQWVISLFFLFFHFSYPRFFRISITTDLVIVEREKTNRSVHSTRLAHFRYCHVDTKLP
jgi:hypothetical protein